jgi:hypothetical protein
MNSPDKHIHFEITKIHPPQLASDIKNPQDILLSKRLIFFKTKNERKFFVFSE